MKDPPQLLAGELVERAERLVEQQHARFVDQRAAQIGALEHAAGKLPGIAAAKRFQSDLLEQRIVLERHADPHRARRDFTAADDDNAGGRSRQARDQPQDGGFAAARWTDQRHELAAGDPQRGLGQGRHGAGAAAEGDGGQSACKLDASGPAVKNQGDRGTGGRGAGFLLGNPQLKLHAIAAPDCFSGMIKRRSKLVSRRIRGNGGARRHQQGRHQQDG
ncbi:hypothetical protein AC628_34325 [Bradyrhizobium sp. NAS96.2]|nr:hypothetical protein AC628_34325 [Bradyrhizobium sp. NAS96.2]